MLTHATGDPLDEAEDDAPSPVVEALEELREMLSEALPALLRPAAPPVVHVEAAAAPVVRVDAPKVHVAPAPAVAWSFEVTARDAQGRILTFTATPNKSNQP